MDARAKLLAVLEDEASALEERIAAGEELAKVGDPRATAIDRVFIEAGPFLFRGGERREPHRVYLSAYSIDRWPVTVASYAQFIDAGGYEEPRYWSCRGWEWRTREAIERPRFWGEDEWAAYLVPNHPVVGVSVYEAEAYATFRGARLPTDAEWEKACRGTDGRCHPWGDAWIEDAAGYRGVGLRGTVSIGSFPKGRSVYGVGDLVGCVWQWCADVADEDAKVEEKDPFVDPEDYEESEKRVTRGGAWNTLNWSVNCTSRNAYLPVARFSNLGFRCVVPGPRG